MVLIVTSLLCSSMPLVAASQIYSVNGTGEYVGYMELKGFDKADKFKIFYSGAYDSFVVKVIDNRNLDLKQLVKWKYRGKTYTHTREQCNQFFSDTSYLKKYTAPGETLSDEWFTNTFGNVYLEWAEYLGFNSEASELVGKYLADQSGIVYEDRFKFADHDIDMLATEWIPQNNIYDLVSFGKYSYFDRSKGKLITDYAFYTQDFMGMELKYLVDEMTDSFMQSSNAQGVFNGIRMKVIDGLLYFSKSDLQAKGII